ncbi:unnamed protein product, partial [Amoebophrya sp. A25]|eukprot:GSA25T00016325001.1
MQCRREKYWAMPPPRGRGLLFFLLGCCLWEHGSAYWRGRNLPSTSGKMLSDTDDARKGEEQDSVEEYEADGELVTTSKNPEQHDGPKGSSQKGQATSSQKARQVKASQMGGRVKSSRRARQEKSPQRGQVPWSREGQVASPKPQVTSSQGGQEASEKAIAAQRDSSSQDPEEQHVVDDERSTKMVFADPAAAKPTPKKVTGVTSASGDLAERTDFTEQRALVGSSQDLPVKQQAQAASSQALHVKQQAHGETQDLPITDRASGLDTDTRTMTKHTNKEEEHHAQGASENKEDDPEIVEDIAMERTSTTAKIPPVDGQHLTTDVEKKAEDHDAVSASAPFAYISRLLTTLTAQTTTGVLAVMRYLRREDGPPKKGKGPEAPLVAVEAMRPTTETSTAQVPEGGSVLTEAAAPLAEGVPAVTKPAAAGPAPAPSAEGGAASEAVAVLGASAESAGLAPTPSTEGGAASEAVAVSGGSAELAGPGLAPAPRIEFESGATRTGGAPVLPGGRDVGTLASASVPSVEGSAPAVAGGLLSRASSADQTGSASAGARGALIGEPSSPSSPNIVEDSTKGSASAPSSGGSGGATGPTTPSTKDPALAEAEEVSSNDAASAEAGASQSSFFQAAGAGFHSVADRLYSSALERCWQEPRQQLQDRSSQEESRLFWYCGDPNTCSSVGGTPGPGPPECATAYAIKEVGDSEAGGAGGQNEGVAMVKQYRTLGAQGQTPTSVQSFWCKRLIENSDSECFANTALFGQRRSRLEKQEGDSRPWPTSVSDTKGTAAAVGGLSFLERRPDEVEPFCCHLLRADMNEANEVCTFLNMRRGGTQEPSGGYLCAPFMDGDLFSILYGETGGRETDGATLTAAIAQHTRRDLDLLGGIQMAHQDIKPENVFYKKLGDGQYLFMLGDLGMACESTSSTKTPRGIQTCSSTREVGTPVHRSPDSLRGQLWHGQLDTLLGAGLLQLPGMGWSGKNWGLREHYAEAVKLSGRDAPRPLARDFHRGDLFSWAEMMVAATLTLCGEHHTWGIPDVWGLLFGFRHVVLDGVDNNEILGIGHPLTQQWVVSVFLRMGWVCASSCTGEEVEGGREVEWWPLLSALSAQTDSDKAAVVLKNFFSEFVPDGRLGALSAVRFDIEESTLGDGESKVGFWLVLAKALLGVSSPLGSYTWVEFPWTHVSRVLQTYLELATFDSLNYPNLVRAEALSWVNCGCKSLPSKYGADKYLLWLLNNEAALRSEERAAGIAARKRAAGMRASTVQLRTGTGTEFVDGGAVTAPDSDAQPTTSGEAVSVSTASGASTSGSGGATTPVSSGSANSIVAAPKDKTTSAASEHHEGDATTRTWSTTSESGMIEVVTSASGVNTGTPKAAKSGTSTAVASKGATSSSVSGLELDTSKDSDSRDSSDTAGTPALAMEKTTSTSQTKLPLPVADAVDSSSSTLDTVAASGTTSSAEKVPASGTSGSAEALAASGSSFTGSDSVDASSTTTTRSAEKSDAPGSTSSS